MCRATIAIFFCFSAVQALGQTTAGSPAKPVTQAKKATASKFKTIAYSCRVMYLPARSIWVRELEVDYDKKAFKALRIDGIAVHGFSAEGSQISTHIDNERIYLDLSAPSWRSEFREAAQGEGACIKSRG